MATQDPNQMNLPGVLPSQPRVAPSVASATPDSSSLPSVQLAYSDLQRINDELLAIELTARNLITSLTLGYCAGIVTPSEDQPATRTCKCSKKSEPSGSTSSPKESSETPKLTGYCNCHTPGTKECMYVPLR